MCYISYRDFFAPGFFRIFINKRNNNYRDKDGGYDLTTCPIFYEKR